MHLNLLGPSNPMLGMGSHFKKWASAIVRKLPESGNDTCFIGPLDKSKNLEWAGEFSNPERFDLKSPTVALWHLSDKIEFSGTPRILYTVWETSRLHDREAACLDKFDIIAVPTKWHANILKEDYKLKDDRVMILPEGATDYFRVIRDIIDQNSFRSSFESLNGKALIVNRTISFVGKLEKRKGVEPMLDAISMLANEDQDKGVTFFLHLFNPFIPHWLNILESMLYSRGFERCSEMSEIDIIRYVKNEVDIFVPVGQLSELRLAFYAYYSAGYSLYPYYAEGWCLPLADSLYSSAIPICQNYSGPSEYLVDGAYFPLTGVEAQAKDNFFFDGTAGTWRQTLAEDILHNIRKALAIRSSERNFMVDIATKQMAKFSWDKSAEEAIKCLRALS